MDKKQFEEFLRHNDESTGKAIEKYVNGGIRALNKKFDEHAEMDLKYQEKIDGNIAWVVKLIVGAVVLGLIASIIK